MKILSLSTDRGILYEDSRVARRMIEYGKLFDQLHVVVFCPQGFREKRLSENVWVYPTNSRSRWLYVWDAYWTGKKILVDVVEPRTGWVITTQDPFETGLVGMFLKRLCGIPLNVQIHTDFGNKYFAEDFLNKVRLVIARFVVRKADSFRVVSKRIEETLKRKYGVQDKLIVILPIWTDVSKYREGDRNFLKDKYQQFEKIILMVSRLSKEKNIQLGIRAFKEVVKKYPKIGLVVVGDGPEMDSLKESRCSNVVFEGWVDDIVAYFRSADIFLNTSDYEGYGLTLIEAIASGIPIVTTDVGLIGSVVTSNDGVYVCSPRDTECITKELIKGITSDTPRPSIVEEVTKEEYLERYRDSIVTTV